MNLQLKRIDFREDGIFGVLSDEAGNLVCNTLEHAYDSGSGDGSYVPKIPAGVYTCLRGEHQLAHMPTPFTTFELQNVPGHSNILLHAGNYNDDSEGCVLLGMSVGRSIIKNCEMLLNSKIAFSKFMFLQVGINEFQLTVI